MNIMLKASFSTTQPNYQDRLKQYYYHNHSRHPNGSTQNKESLSLNYNSLKEAPEDGASSTVPKDTMLHFEIPQRTRQKFISAEDAVALVRDGDTVCVSGFVSQGAPEAVLKALGERYENTSSPNNLSLLFGGGPGDWDKRGLNHLAKKKVASCPMLKRVIGSHYGQVPAIAELALSNEIEAWTLPLGSISRMIRAQSTHSPGHITNIGIGTYVDPSMSGGAANEAALQSELHKKLISRIKIDDQDNLMYKALPINVAIIRGTTADSQVRILSFSRKANVCDVAFLLSRIDSLLRKPSNLSKNHDGSLSTLLYREILQ
jgi:acyl CoA:acetate/3-ketoacid CoA transferase alpha subunit